MSKVEVGSGFDFCSGFPVGITAVNPTGISNIEQGMLNVEVAEGFDFCLGFHVGMNAVKPI